MLWVPRPALDGSKILPVIPLPENTPPDGIPVNITVLISTQYSLAKPLNVTRGKALTITDCDSALVQPFPSVYV